jgi:hypothetical protein
MDAGKYDYKMQRDGEQNFILTNTCGSVRYKVDAKRSYTITWKNDDDTVIDTTTVEY